MIIFMHSIRNVDQSFPPYKSRKAQLHEIFSFGLYILMITDTMRVEAYVHSKNLDLCFISLAVLVTHP